MRYHDILSHPCVAGKKWLFSHSKLLKFSLDLHRQITNSRALNLTPVSRKEYSKDVQRLSAVFTSPRRQLTSFTESKLCFNSVWSSSYSVTAAQDYVMLFVQQRASDLSGLPFQDDMASNTGMTVFVSFLLSESVHVSILQAQVIGVFMMAAIVAPSL